MSNFYYTDVRVKKNTLYFTGIKDDKSPLLQSIEYKPVMFKPSDSGNWTDIHGKSMEPIKFDSIGEAKGALKRGGGYCGFERWESQFLGYTFHNKPNIKYEDLKVYSIDIETTANNFPVIDNPVEKLLCITIVSLNSNEVFTFSSIKSDFNSPYENSHFYQYDSEVEMINSFLKWWSNNPPHIITGWNSSAFDLPYMVARFDTYDFNLKSYLSPHRIIQTYKRFNSSLNREVPVVRIFGIQHLDYLELYKKFTYQMQTSYKLDNIAFVELGERKIDHTQYETFKEFYENDYDLFLEYNQKDAYLIKRFEHKLSLLKLAVLMAYDAKCNFEDCFSPIRIWDSIIFNYLNSSKIVLPQLEDIDDIGTIQGGRVKEPKPGLYDWVVTFDLTSLYPSIIMGLNISPETLLDGSIPVNIKDIVDGNFKNTEDCSLAANGAKYKRDKDGFLPVLVEKLFGERKAFKKRMLSKKQELENIEKEMKKRGLL